MNRKLIFKKFEELIKPLGFVKVTDKTSEGRLYQIFGEFNYLLTANFKYSKVFGAELGSINVFYNLEPINELLRNAGVDHFELPFMVSYGLGGTSLNRMSLEGDKRVIEIINKEEFGIFNTDDIEFSLKLFTDWAVSCVNSHKDKMNSIIDFYTYLETTHYLRRPNSTFDGIIIFRLWFRAKYNLPDYEVYWDYVMTMMNGYISESPHKWAKQGNEKTKEGFIKLHNYFVNNPNFFQPQDVPFEVHQFNLDLK